MSKRPELPEHVKLCNPNPTDGNKNAVHRLKCILIGDECIGKSSLVRSFILSDDLSFSKYLPTTGEEYSVHKRMKDVSGSGTGSQRFKLTICDTGGQNEMDRLRPLFYNKVDVVIVCFSVINPSSFNNITTKWLPEIKRHASDAKILLVGTQSDLRCNIQVLLQLSRQGLAPIPESRAMQLVQKIGAKNYIECSSLKNKNVKLIFDHTMTWGLQKTETKQFGSKTINYESKKRKILSREWRSRKCAKLKKILFISCIFH